MTVSLKRLRGGLAAALTMAASRHSPPPARRFQHSGVSV